MLVFLKIAAEQRFLFVFADLCVELSEALLFGGLDFGRGLGRMVNLTLAFAGAHRLLLEVK